MINFPRNKRGVSFTLQSDLTPLRKLIGGLKDMRNRSGEGWGQLPRAMARALAGANLNGYEGRVLWAIVYKTIAFNKVSDHIPQSQIVELTGIDQRHLYRTIKGLLKKGIILKKGSVYGFQLDFNEWENTPNQVYKKRNTPNQGKNTPNQAHSRDLSKRAFQEKGLSASFRKKKHEEFKKGFEMMKEVMRKVPDKKKEIFQLEKRELKEH